MVFDYLLLVSFASPFFCFLRHLQSTFDLIFLSFFSCILFLNTLSLFTWFYLVYLILPSFTEFYLVLPSFTEFYLVLPSFT